MTSSVLSAHSKTKTIALWLFVAATAAAFLLVVAPQPASGDPIDDSQLKPYRAGWFSNECCDRKGPLSQEPPPIP